ncbi:MAG TPA: DUF3606 domain-containing protein [Holophagaceae bacterium]
MFEGIQLDRPQDPDIRPVASQEIIHIHDPYEVRDWAIYFSVSQDKIRAAVATVGPWVKDVKAFLGR